MAKRTETNIPISPVDQKRMDTAVAEIGTTILHLETVETRMGDSLDFSDQAVWDLKQALEEAYKAGMVTGFANGLEAK